MHPNSASSSITTPCQLRNMNTPSVPREIPPTMSSAKQSLAERSYAELLPLGILPMPSTISGAPKVPTLGLRQSTTSFSSTTLTSATSFEIDTECTIDDTGRTLLSTLESSRSMAEAQCLSENGYVFWKKLCDSLQGELFEARPLDGSPAVVIKKIDKRLHRKRISEQNGMNIVVEENIIKETILLHHLTVENRPTSDYLVKFLKFFESESYFYLVMENAGTMNLAAFNERAHRLIADGKLKIREWRKILKFLMWQLSVTVYWLHRDMKCCHLDLSLENVMVQNSNFIEHEDGAVTVDPNIKIKLCDFGLAEVFRADTDCADSAGDDDDGYALNPFKCTKHAMKDRYYLSAPRVFGEEPYDARKADMWALGVIFYELATGNEPFASQQDSDENWQFVRRQQFVPLLVAQQKAKYLNQGMLQLLRSLLSVEENERADCGRLLESEWLRTYHSKYRTSILKKTKQQMARTKKHRESRPEFPFYECIE